jgi:DNA-binding NarL/FixJ family response regulator
LHRALEGEALLSGRLAARLVEEFRERGRRKRILAGRAPGTELTRREWQVLELLAAHLTTAEIAARLFLEPVTIRTHIARILRKLQVPSRQAALRLLEERKEPPAAW